MSTSCDLTGLFRIFHTYAISFNNILTLSFPSYIIIRVKTKGSDLAEFLTKFIPDNNPLGNFLARDNKTTTSCLKS